jgi:chromosome partitioning protein
VGTDLVLLPARPSPHDLRVVGVIVEMAEASGIPFCFVVNGATPRATIALEAVRALTQQGKVTPVTLRQLINFAASMVDGRTVGELNPQSRSAASEGRCSVSRQRGQRRLSCPSGPLCYHSINQGVSPNSAQPR